MKIVVIGAGLAGMAAARKLQQAGAEVEIYEASDRVAGRACTIRKPGTDDKADVGTQYFHTINWT